MAASSNDSFGLKIATALSIALTVVLLVSVYFLNSSYNQEFEKRARAESDLAKSSTLVRDMTAQSNYYRGQIGYEGIEDPEAAKAAMKKDVEAIKSDIQAINTEIGTMIGEHQRKAAAKNVDVAQFDALKQRAGEVVDSFSNNPDQSYKAQLVRLKDLTVNQAKLTTALALDYIDLRSNLEQTNKVNQDAKAVVEQGLNTARAELADTIKKDEDARQELVAKTRQQAEDMAASDAKLNNVINDLTQNNTKKEKSINDLRTIVGDLRDRDAQKEDVLGKSGGRVTYVNYEANEVRVSVNRSQGVRPLMRFSIFDQKAVGLASDKPKATVELINVGDPRRGQADSLARIVKTFDPANPIRYNDNIFSPGWSYDHPQRFDLVGKIDVNRDGRDDRADLIRLIEASGGIIEFDLPPPNVDRGPGIAAVARGFARVGEPVPTTVGRAAGKISGLAYGYVIDRRASLITFAKKSAGAADDDTAFLQEESAATKEARDNAVRPLPLEKLLNMLGYDYSAPIQGRREAYDKNAVKQMLKPKTERKPAEATPPASDEPK